MTEADFENFEGKCENEMKKVFGVPSIHGGRS